MKKVYLIWSQDRPAPTRTHQSLSIARAEAERLARLPGNKGIKFIIFSSVEAVKSIETPVKWESCQ